MSKTKQMLRNVDRGLARAKAGLNATQERGSHGFVEKVRSQAEAKVVEHPPAKNEDNCAEKETDAPQNQARVRDEVLVDVPFHGDHGKLVCDVSGLHKGENEEHVHQEPMLVASCVPGQDDPPDGNPETQNRKDQGDVRKDSRERCQNDQADCTLKIHLNKAHKGAVLAIELL